ncbi:MAG: nucleotidyltransferase domain-containing protein [Deltaproteobacteria bacterium]|nr:nucleotidyltransferase domain-containing protein [Deltaproteobacteria bacterium]
MRAISTACAHFQVRRLELFGSFAKGREGKRSDVDFLVEFESMPPAEHAKAYFGLLEELGNIFNRKVDLVELKGVKNPYFLKAVGESREVVYG